MIKRTGMTLILVAAVTAGAPRLSGRDDPPAGASSAVVFTTEERSRVLQHSPLGPPPPDGNRFADNPLAARFGQFLFFDPRLSGNGQVSCATCHDPARAFSDGKPIAEGMGRGTRNAISLWNASYNRWFFWDGRADSLWSQALKPMERSAELGGDRVAIARLIRDDPALRAAYERAVGPLPVWRDAQRSADSQPASGQAPAPLSEQDQAIVNGVFANVGKSIAAYERKLLSRRSPFDIFVVGLRTGDPARLAALSDSAQRGLKLFVGRGDCRLCHSGPTFSDGEFHDTGVPPRGSLPPDPGRMEGIRLLLADPFNAASVFSDASAPAPNPGAPGDPGDPGAPGAPGDDASERLKFIAQGPQNYGEFKTPTLRNVALTAPYMHQGQFATIQEVIEYYSTLRGSTLDAHHRESVLRARQFSPEEAADLVEFLKSLTDTDIDKSLMSAPGSP